MWALDGKTVRGARNTDGGQVHLVSVLDQASGGVLAQAQVDAKSGELAAVPSLPACSPGSTCTGSWSAEQADAVAEAALTQP